MILSALSSFRSRKRLKSKMKNEGKAEGRKRTAHSAQRCCQPKSVVRRFLFFGAFMIHD